MVFVVQWHEGMLLSPQHFQQSDNYFQHILSKIGPNFSYGVCDFQIDTAALTSGIVRIMKTSGFFQDGLYFDFDAMQDKPLEKNLSEYFSSNSAPIKIYLAVYARHIGGNLLSGATARYYSAEVANINDENIGDNPINIPILKPRLQLLSEDEVDARYTAFPIVELTKTQDKGIVMTDFLPPFIEIDEHSKISQMCREIIQLTREKISYFADRKDNFERNMSDESMTCLRLLIQSVLPLEAMVNTKRVHPFEIYKFLIQMTSSIIAIYPSHMIQQMPAYNHENLFDVFNGLVKFSKDILQNLKRRYDVIKFVKEENIFKLAMKKEWLQQNEMAIGIRKSYSITDDDILQWIKGVQIASESMLPLLKDRRILGAERRILERGEFITQPAGVTIIAVNPQNFYIKPAEKLCLVNNSLNFTPEEVTLYAE